MTLKALLIDLDNTLIDRDQAVRKFCTALFRDQNWDASQIEPAVDALMAWDDHGYADRNTWAARVCEQARLDESEFWSQFRSRVPAFITPDPNVTQLLRSWSKQYRVAIVTNGTSSLQRAKLAAAGLDGIAAAVVISEEVGSWKPELAIFRIALERLEVSASEALFIGDDQHRDIAPAASLGMQTHWLEPPFFNQYVRLSSIDSRLSLRERIERQLSWSEGDYPSNIGQ